MEAQWELVNTFEDILSEMARSLEELLPVEANLPKLDRQRTSVTEGEPQWDWEGMHGL